MVDSGSLYIGLLTGVIGAGFFIYGKKQQEMIPLLCGVALGVYPWFVNGMWALILVGIVLCVIPFVFRS